MRAGLYAVVDRPSPPDRPPYGDPIEAFGMKLMLSGVEVVWPDNRERLALARYAALMYQRAPLVESAIMAHGEAFDRGAQHGLDRLFPGIRSPIRTVLGERRERFAGRARDIGDALSRAHWWVVRAGRHERFVLGDSAVAATISLGHEDTFRAILSPESYLVVMPLGPTLALLMAPQGIAPVNVELADIVRAINQLIWRWSDRYVAALSRDDLDGVWGSDVASRRSSLTATDGPEGAEAAGRAVVGRSRLKWDIGQMEKNRPTWVGCRRIFQVEPYAAEDRHFILPQMCPMTPPPLLNPSIE